VARRLAALGATPNAVSLASIVFAAVAGVAFYKAGRHGLRGGDLFVLLGGAQRWRAAAAWWLVLAAACVQFRLLCNLLDGLLAIEGGLKSNTGELYNEIPDRVADALILVGAGYAVGRYGWGPALGWTAAMLAVLTAYVRLLGGSLGLVQSFRGPMAKQHRMFVLTIGTLAAAMEIAVRGTRTSLTIALLIIIIGAAVTLVLRVRRIAEQLAAR
jgi:phosphatidylglycerophosphate synthase